MHLDPFELHTPTTLEAALALARDLPGQFDYLAGGTDLLPNYKMHLNLRPHLISLERVAELGGIAPDRIGAMVRLADLERDPRVREQTPVLAQAASEVATPLVRASGTVGGNLLVETRCFFFNQSRFWRASLGYCLKAEGDACHVVPQKERCYATFSGDLAPVLAVLGATVELAGPEGRRSLSLPQLYDAAGDGIKRLALRPGEIVVAVRLPPEASQARAAYLKLRIRPAFDFPELGVAAALWGNPSEPERLALCVGGIDTYPHPFDEEAQRLAGAPLAPERLASLGTEVAQKLRPVHNTFLAADYRKKMIEVYVRRAFQAAQQAGPSGRAE